MSSSSLSIKEEEPSNLEYQQNALSSSSYNEKTNPKKLSSSSYSESSSEEKQQDKVKDLLIPSPRKKFEMIKSNEQSPSSDSSKSGPKMKSIDIISEGSSILNSTSYSISSESISDIAKNNSDLDENIENCVHNDDFLVI